MNKLKKTLLRFGLTCYFAGFTPIKIILVNDHTGKRNVLPGFFASMFLVMLPAAAQASPGDSIGSGRLLPTLAAVIGLIGVIIGKQAQIERRRHHENGWGKAITAMILASISLSVGGLHATSAAGGFGTGNGLAGAVVAILMGLAGLILGCLALISPRRTTTGSNHKDMNSGKEKT